MTDHYFTASPASAHERRSLAVHLAGREVTVRTAAGIFSPDGLDKGTRVLLDQVPPPPMSGTFLDLGCGWGPIALSLAMTSPAARVYAVDVNERALDLLRGTADDLGLSNLEVGTARSVPPEAELDLIWSNPPIRIGKQALHELLRTWLPRLAVGGEAWMVVGKNLGADSLQAWLIDQLPAMSVTREGSAKGFRVLRVVRHRCDGTPTG